jgi:hypothetical protein
MKLADRYMQRIKKKYHDIQGSRTRAWRLAVPMWVLCTFVANFKLVKVSERCAFNGLAMTNISVLELPPRENWRR